MYQNYQNIRLFALLGNMLSNCRKYAMIVFQEVKYGGIVSHNMSFLNICTYNYTHIYNNHNNTMPPNRDTTNDNSKCFHIY